MKSYKKIYFDCGYKYIMVINNNHHHLNLCLLEYCKL